MDPITSAQTYKIVLMSFLPPVSFPDFTLEATDVIILK